MFKEHIVFKKIAFFSKFYLKKLHFFKILYEREEEILL